MIKKKLKNNSYLLKKNDHFKVQNKSAHFICFGRRQCDYHSGPIEQNWPNRKWLFSNTKIAHDKLEIVRKNCQI